MRLGSLFFVLSCLIFIKSGIANGGQSQLEITGAVKRGFKINRIDPRLSQKTYEVSVLVKNISDTEFKFNRVRGAFVPPKGISFIIFIVKEGPNRREENFVLRPGESEELHFTSNGSTQELIRNTSSEALQFRIELIMATRILAGPYYADLPNLNTLEKREGVSLSLIDHKM